MKTFTTVYCHKLYILIIIHIFSWQNQLLTLSKSSFWLFKLATHPFSVWSIN